MKDLKIITVVPADLAFAWEIEIVCENYRKYNLSDKLTVLIAYNEDSEKFLNYWGKLEDKYNEVIFRIYDVNHIKNLINTYIPIIRPYCLKEYFKANPELKNKAIYYVDSDVIFTKSFDFNKYKDSDTIYASDISSYNNYQYFDSKKKDVMMHKKAQYEKLDVLDCCAKIIGITGELIRKSPMMGGCQYILKNIDWQFWEKVQEDCIKIKLYLTEINQTFFPSEEKGIQSWCTDLFVIWWNLLKRGDILSTPEDMNFSWATSPIEDWNKNSIYHNAGIVKGQYLDTDKKIKIFNKSDVRFRNNIITPFDIQYWGETSKNYCNYNYLEIIKNMSGKAISKTKGILKY